MCVCVVELCVCVWGGGIMKQSCYVIYCDARLIFVVLTVFIN